MNIPQTIPELYVVMTTRFDAIDTRLDKHDDLFGRIESRLDKHDELLELIASHTSRLVEDMSEVKSISGDHEDRISRLERQVARLTFAK